MNEITTQQNEVAKQLDFAVLQVIGQDNIIGFQKAFQVAEATRLLKEVLNEEYMKPIMLLQGSRLGFKTDKDTSGGYHASIVKQCLIEAVLMGVQPSMNHFNIISSNCYLTKEGFGYLLSRLQGLSYEIVPFIPKVEGEQATIIMKITWSMNGGKTEVRENEFVIKVNRMMGADAIIGKATRKARAWLYNTLTGSELGDGDITDADIPKTTNTIAITPTVEANLSPQAEKVDASTKAEVEKAKDKKAKAEALAGTHKPINVPDSIEDAKVVSETKTEVSYKELVLKMTPPQIVEELKNKLPYITKEVFEGATGQKLNAKTVQAILIDFNDNILEITLDKIYGTSSEKLKAWKPVEEKQEAEKPLAETRTENDAMTQMSINDEFIDNNVDSEEGAKELGYANADEMLKFGTLKQCAEYVKSKKA
jgi:hypothetical protein